MVLQIYSEELVFLDVWLLLDAILFGQICVIHLSQFVIQNNLLEWSDKESDIARKQNTIKFATYVAEQMHKLQKILLKCGGEKKNCRSYIVSWTRLHCVHFRHFCYCITRTMYFYCLTYLTSFTMIKVTKMLMMIIHKILELIIFLFFFLFLTAKYKWW